MIKSIETITMSELVDVRHVYELASPASNAPSNSALALIKGYVDRNGQLYRIDRQGNLIKRTVTNDNDYRKCYRLRINDELFTIAIPQHKVDAAFQAKNPGTNRSLTATDRPEPTYTWGYILYDTVGDVEETVVGFATEQNALVAVQNEIKIYFESGFIDYTGVVFQTTGKIVSASPKFNYE